MIEIRQILKDLGMEILSMKEAGVDIDIVENGKSFRGKCDDQSRSDCRAAGSEGNGCDCAGR